MTAAISVEHLVKRYGEHAAVDDVSFEVARGEVVGFLGPNGAGKSTTLRILVGFLGATSGRARIEGHDVVEAPDEARQALGYMPEAVPLYPEMRVREYLRFRAELKGVPRAKRTAAVGDAMARAHITDVADTLIDHLSKGYRQRVGLADALVSKPRVLVLDEPTAGMDPNQIRDVREVIKSLGGEHTVLLSTHILPEVEASCGRVVVIDKGKLVAQGTPEELASLRAPPRLEVVVRGAAAAVLLAIEKVNGEAGKRGAGEGLPLATIASLRTDGDVQRLVLETADPTGETAEALVSAFVAEGLKVRTVAPAKTSLEDVFASLTTAGNVDTPDADPDADANADANADADADANADANADDRDDGDPS